LINPLTRVATVAADVSPLCPPSTRSRGLLQPLPSTPASGIYFPTMRPCLPRLLPVWAVLALATVTAPAASDPFAEGVRPTPWQAPAEQQKAFQLPPGFEIQLVAAEPDLNKPFNLAFDALGRLWVTTSIEYPFAAPTNRPGRDRLMVFEDFGPDGRARKVTEFAGGLNIPIGVYPFFSTSPGARKPTWKAIVWSIPHVWLFEDRDGDGKADHREVLYGPFDHTRDTHGNQASFRRGFDGWLYATHGFNNDSHVKGRDGHQVDLNSGNTYRLRLDGSRIEHHTHGQVNPYGLAFDPEGSLFASDCHSEPIYQLLAGGYYPSFGKPHDGLGFAPKMMAKPRGSTAIDGISVYADDLWPPEFRGNLFIGDVMTSRVYRDRVTEEGSTRLAHPMPDFLSTTDPWFRPVDTCLGPDGALYVADFYNRIIGHYEVPLTHPGRDRTSGRLWRIVRTRTADAPPRLGPWQPVAAKDSPALLWPRPDFLKASARELVAELSHPNLPRRLLAMNTLADRFGAKAARELRATAPGGSRHYAAGEDAPAARSHALWLLHRFGELDPATLQQAARAPDALVRIHAQRVATDLFHQQSLAQPAATPARLEAARAIAVAGLQDANALVQRCAAEALARDAQAPGAGHLRPLLDLVQRVPSPDTHLLYVVRKAVRDQLRHEGAFQSLLDTPLNDADRRLLTGVALGVPNAASAAFLLRQLPDLTRLQGDAPATADILKHAARYAPESELDRLAAVAAATLPERGGPGLHQELERQFALLKSVEDGLQQRGRPRPPAIRAWGTNLVWRFFGSLDGHQSWTPLPLASRPTAIPWDLETRTRTDGKKRLVASSLPHGESLTGVLRSPDFPMPASLSFWFCGHDGFPDQPAGGRNLIRLRLLEDNRILATAPAPRHDTARRVTWSFPERVGQPVYVEAVDGDAGPSYAWIGFGDFEPDLPQLRPTEFSPRRMRDSLASAADAAARLEVRGVSPFLALLLTPRDAADPGATTEDYAGLARAWVNLDPGAAVPGLAATLAARRGSPAYREGLALVLATQARSEAQRAVVTTARALPLKSQETIAQALAGSAVGAETLLAAIEDGAVSPRVLQRNSVVNRLKSAKPANAEARLQQLTARLPAPDDARNQLIARRRAAYLAAPGRPEAGRQVFTKQCASCHQIDREGAVVGPQLDGIGQRGLDRLCEDILDPNRNVDGAFRSTLLTLKDGDIVSGLFRREEGETVVLAESTGKEVSVAKRDILERHTGTSSLMPENFGDLLNPQEFADLMAYLLSRTAAAR
ncbi:MAG: hypothetical protein RJA22_2081, partial [Verrucomicrobiota bacterium]